MDGQAWILEQIRTLPSRSYCSCFAAIQTSPLTSLLVPVFVHVFAPLVVQSAVHANPNTAQTAQGNVDLIMVDSVGDQLARFADFDGDGLLLGPDDVSSLTPAMGPKTPRAAAVRTEAGAAFVYWVDSSNDRFWKATDVNGNGRLDKFERTLVRDSGTLDGASQPNSLAATGDGDLWWCSDQGMRGVFVLRDAGGDGSLKEAEDWIALAGDVPGAGLKLEVATDAGPAPADVLNFVRLLALDPALDPQLHHSSGTSGTGAGTALANLSSAVLAYGDGKDEAWLRFDDIDRDGKLTSAGEARLFLNASGKNADFPLQADFAAGSLPDLEIPNANGNGAKFYGRLRHAAVCRTGDQRNFYFATDSALGSSFGLNTKGQGLNGRIFLGRDLNQDGDVQDPGEMRNYYDGSSTSPLSALAGFDQILGLGAQDDRLFVLYTHGSDLCVARLFDANKDGDAMDFGEAQMDLFSLTAWGPKAPFSSGPLVRDLLALPAGCLGEPNNAFLAGGESCSVFDPAQPPTLHGIGHARIGQSSFRCELRGATGGTIAMLGFGDDRITHNGHFLPIQLWTQPTCLLQVGILDMRLVATSGPPGMPHVGWAEHAFSIADDPQLIGALLRLQWFVIDIHQAGWPLAMTGWGEVRITQ